ncbi:GNAT family N-acetyltransferase [Aequorivita sp. F47161]|uniref:GNAT family N-acetyltransferase n=1 Tax=Aequorivita vitellina TaxID=2874475 RepID=A0A9X1U436_9FLAO|nr:GNAT family N-acetyltransferase [Aequorivita vitellina]MCG2420183.1 GNAT family N-acetyltransferase [Aequorivita vitellina]
MIQTERLILREYSINDAPFVFELMNSEGWLKNIGDRNIKSIEEAESYLEKNYLSNYKKYGYGPFLVSLKEDGSPIGSSGLYKRESLDFPDIGFAFLSQFFNQGYAFEASMAVMKYAKETLKLQTITGITLPTNASSIKLLKKLGLLEVGLFTYENGEELLLFSN